MSNNIDHTCDKDSRISVMESKICRLEKDFKEHTEKVSQLDKTIDKHSEINIRIENRLENIEKTLKEIQDERKSNKSFWRDKGVGLISAIITGITLTFLLIRLGLK